MPTQHDRQSASLLTDASRRPAPEYRPETPAFQTDGLARRHTSKVDVGGLAGSDNCQCRVAFAAVFIQEVFLWQVKGSFGAVPRICFIHWCCNWTRVETAEKHDWV